MESQNAAVCCSPTRQGESLRKPLCWGLHVLYPEGSPVISVAVISETGRDVLGLAVLFQLPWQRCRRPGPRMHLWLHWGSGGCIRELLPSWWSLWSQSTGRLSAKLKVLQIPQMLPNAQVVVSTSNYSCTFHGRWPPASIKGCGFERLNCCDMFCNPQIIKGGKKNEISQIPSINSENAAYSLPPSCFQTFNTPCQPEHSNKPLPIWEEKGRGAQNLSVMNFISNPSLLQPAVDPHTQTGTSECLMRPARGSYLALRAVTTVPSGL